jgi:putative tryptophan/tyrosine transport system substrate-binding protein
VFDKLRQLHADALNIAPDNLFTAHIEQLAALTVRRGLPAIFEFRRFVAAGGLMSYGTSEAEYYRLVGTYTGRILKGESPTDLPVQQATKLELMINLNTAKAMGLTIPVALLGRTDDVDRVTIFRLPPCCRRSGLKVALTCRLPRCSDRVRNRGVN